MSIFSKAADVVRSALGAEHAGQIRWIVDQANLWRTDGVYTATEYATEITRRMRYLDKDQDAHLLEQLKIEFEKTWEKMQHQMVRMPLQRFIVEKKARAFRGVGSRFVLRDSKDKEAEAESAPAVAFKRLLDAAQLDLVLPEWDCTIEEAHSGALRVTWNPGAGKVEVWPYDPTCVHVAPNPDQPNDAHSARAVAFERDGEGGPRGEHVFDVFGVRDEDVAGEKANGLLVFEPSVHYTGTLTKPMRAPEGDANPIKDRLTGKAIVPFAWFSDKRERIYHKGSDALVQMSSLVNMGLTWLNHNASWQMAALPVITATQGVDLTKLDELKKLYMATPTFVSQLPAGCDLKFVSPEKDLGKFLTFYETLIQYLALMNHLAPKSISIQDGTPQAGIAMQLEMVSLSEYRDQRIKLYEPQVLRLLEVMISVWNLYAPMHYKDPSLKIGNEWRPGWEPGRLDTGPVDAAALKDKYVPAIESGAATVDDWAAELHGISIEDARKKVEENVERTAELRKKLTRYPEPPAAADREGAGLPIKKDIPPEMKAQQDALEAEAGKPTDEDEEQARPEPEKKPVPAAAPDSKDEKKAPAKDAEADGLGLEKVNIYQIIKAMENGAATVVDLRMALFHEDRKTAEAMVKKAIAYNQQVAGKVGQALAAKAAPLAKSGGILPSDGSRSEQ